MHATAGKGDSPQVVCRMLHSPGPIGSGEAALHRSGTPRAQESAERPWWRRMNKPEEGVWRLWSMAALGLA